MNNINIKILPPQDAFKTLDEINEKITTTILDPWYNKGVGGVRDDYEDWLNTLVEKSALISDHVFVWGFPEIVHKVLENIPANYYLVAWLTWYYKNCPSVIRGWRSAQYTCLHLARNGSKLFPEHFLNGVQLEKQQQGKLRFMPGPSSVIEAPLIIGFVGKNEQTGHPAQKPENVILPLISMTTKDGDTVLDPLCGSGTTGAVCKKLNRNSILGDISEEWLEVSRKRIEAIKTGNEYD